MTPRAHLLWTGASLTLSSMLSLPELSAGEHTGRLAGLCQTPLPPANGSAIRQWQTVQTAKAEEDDFVIYRYEWLNQGAVLGPFGMYHFESLGRRLAHVPFPIVLQTSGSLALDQARRSAIVAQLTAAGVHDADQRVRVGFPQAEGLPGTQADRINLLLNRGGAGGGTSSNLTGAAGQSVFGGSGSSSSGFTGGR